MLVRIMYMFVGGQHPTGCKKQLSSLQFRNCLIDELGHFSCELCQHWVLRKHHRVGEHEAMAAAVSWNCLLQQCGAQYTPAAGPYRCSADAEEQPHKAVMVHWPWVVQSLSLVPHSPLDNPSTCQGRTHLVWVPAQLQLLDSPALLLLVALARLLHRLIYRSPDAAHTEHACMPYAAYDMHATAVSVEQSAGQEESRGSLPLTVPGGALVIPARGY